MVLLFGQCNSGWYVEWEYISSHGIVVKIYFLNVFDLVRRVILSQFINQFVADLISEKEVILLKSWFFQLWYNILNILNCRSDQIEGFEMWKFFGCLLSLLNQINVILIQFWLSINNWYHWCSLFVQQKCFHAWNLCENIVKVILCNVEDIWLSLLYHTDWFLV